MKDVELETLLKNLGNRLARVETALELVDIDLPTKEAEAVLSEPDDDWAERWTREGIKSKLTGLIVAPENVGREHTKRGTELDGKVYFTYDEAMELEKNLPDGWRLPTRSEWVLLAEEFGQDEAGELDSNIFAEKLNLPLTGYFYGGSLGNTGVGFYWSRTTYSSYAYSAYCLLFYSSGVSPQDYYGKRYGFAVRLVKEDK